MTLVVDSHGQNRLADNNGERNRRRGTTFKVSAAAAITALLVGMNLSPVAATEHEIQPGESLSRIAEHHSVPLTALAEKNNIRDANLIRSGKILEIPAPPNHKVAPGDNLSTIAVKTGTTVTELAELNNIENVNGIRIGSRLTLPWSAFGPASTTGSTSVAKPATSGSAPSLAARYPNLPQRLQNNPERLKLLANFEAAAKEFDVPADLVMAMSYRESGWQSKVVSHKDAIGIGQILPHVAVWIANDLIGEPGLDPFNPQDNIRMTARYIKWLIAYMDFERATTQEVKSLSRTDRAIAGYYQGPGSVNSSRGAFDDTQAYIDNIALLRHRFLKSA